MPDFDITPIVPGAPTNPPLVFLPDDYIATGNLVQMEQNVYVNNGTLNYYYSKKVSSCCG